MLGKGLLRLFFALWVIWTAFAVADSYKELATYAGYDRWTVEQALERNQKKYGAECEANPGGFACMLLASKPNGEVVKYEDAKRRFKDFVNLVVIAPLILLLLLVSLYLLGKWVVNGFRKNDKN
jgi:hypothetical protein